MLTIKFDTDNDAFADNMNNEAEECARILNVIANQLRSNDGLNCDNYVFDLNGNKVGTWRLDCENDVPF